MESRRGMSLVEILIAIFIIAILGALAFPTINSSMANNSLREAVNEFKFVLGEARARAAERNVAVGILVDVGTPMGGTLEMRESPDRDCGSIDNTGLPLRTLALGDARFGESGLVSIEMGGGPVPPPMDLCVRPEGGVYVRPANTVITGPVRFFFRRYESGTPEGVERILRLSFNGVPRIER